jgi:hypothetical protein
MAPVKGRVGCGRGAAVVETGRGAVVGATLVGLPMVSVTVNCPAEEPELA